MRGFRGDVFHHVADGLHFFRVFIRNIEVELFFHRHHEFNDVEAVCAEVVDERSGLGDLVGFDSQLIANEVTDSFFNRSGHEILS